jgi:hypothetical protein
VADRLSKFLKLGKSLAAVFDWAVACFTGGVVFFVVGRKIGIYFDGLLVRKQKNGDVIV